MDWGRGRAEERALIAARLRERPLAHWILEFDRAGIPFSPLYSAGEAARTPQGDCVGVLASTRVKEHDISIPNIPIHIGSGAAEDRGPRRVSAPPELGEHTEEFLREIESL